MTEQQPSTSDEVEEDKIFLCKVCSLEEKYDFYGMQPHFTKPIEFQENVYVMKDPFSPPSAGKISTCYLLLGADCSLCKQQVCADQQTCSVFYDRRYCRDCALPLLTQFPQEVQKDLMKMKANNPELSENS